MKDDLMLIGILFLCVAFSVPAAIWFHSMAAGSTVFGLLLTFHIGTGRIAAAIEAKPRASTKAE